MHLDYSNSIPATKKNINLFNKNLYNKRIRSKQIINDGVHTLRVGQIDKVERGQSIQMLHIKGFQGNISEKAYKPRSQWILSINFSDFLKKIYYEGNFKIRNENALICVLT